MATTFSRTLPKGWRIGQFEFNFLAWLKEEKGYTGEFNDGKWCENCRRADTFNLSDDEWMKLRDEYFDYLHNQRNS